MHIIIYVIIYAYSCGSFKAYAAGRFGDNSEQYSLLHLRDAESDSSILAPLNDDIQWVYSTAKQQLTYTLSAGLSLSLLLSLSLSLALSRALSLALASLSLSRALALALARARAQARALSALGKQEVTYCPGQS